MQQHLQPAVEEISVSKVDAMLLTHQSDGKPLLAILLSLYLSPSLVVDMGQVLFNYRVHFGGARRC
jgi:hypothetical protein